jgi:hypothetical protein
LERKDKNNDRQGNFKTIRRHRMRMKVALIIFMVSVFSLINCSAQPSEQDLKKGRVVFIDGEPIILYEKSYALLIGIWDYQKGWRKFKRENVENDMIILEKALKRHNFEIKKVMNPTYEEIKNELERFKNDYGLDKNNRLLFYFSGHGTSRYNYTLGYIVPMDAPFPKTPESEKKFLKKAISMEYLKTIAKEIVSKHVLFVFDSCFSGTILQPKSGIVPGYIKRDTAKPVRQFITAGKANQPVPEKSIFTPAFIRGIKGKADLYTDGYITGSELYQYIKPEVVKHDTGQEPQSGTIIVHDNQCEGDFVFILNGSPPPPSCTVTIKSTPDNAEIEIDGINKGKTPKTIELYKGKKYNLKIKKKGHRTYTETIDCNQEHVDAILERRCFESLGCVKTVPIGTILETRENFEYSNDKKYWICFMNERFIWPMVEISEPKFSKSVEVPTTGFHGGALVLVEVPNEINEQFNNLLGKGSHKPLLNTIEFTVILETIIRLEEIKISSKKYDFNDYSAFPTNKIFVNLRMSKPIFQLRIDWGDGESGNWRLDEISIHQTGGDWNVSPVSYIQEENCHLYFVSHKYNSPGHKNVEITIFEGGRIEHQESKKIEIKYID